jgi:hypothetical protein
MAHVSAELRWFIDASEAAQVHALGDWFEAGPSSPIGDALRIDLYAAESSADLGAKQRGGKSQLELKVLVEPRLCTIRIGAREASAQLWSKVSSEVLILPATDEHRRVVHKRRSMRTYALVGDVAREVSPDAETRGERGAVGCNVEWTHVELPGRRTAWTFGLEAFAFGDSAAPLIPTLERALRSTAAALARREGGIPPLDSPWQELSYPAWLQCTA